MIPPPGSLPFDRGRKCRRVGIPLACGARDGISGRHEVDRAHQVAEAAPDHHARDRGHGKHRRDRRDEADDGSPSFGGQLQPRANHARTRGWSGRSGTAHARWTQHRLRSCATGPDCSKCPRWRGSGEPYPVGRRTRVEPLHCPLARPRHLAGPGYRPFKPAARVRIPSGLPPRPTATQAQWARQTTTRPDPSGSGRVVRSRVTQVSRDATGCGRTAVRRWPGRCRCVGGGCRFRCRPHRCRRGHRCCRRRCGRCHHGHRRCSHRCRLA